VYPVPDGAHQRRMEFRRAFGGPQDDPEAIPPVSYASCEPVVPESLPESKPVHVSGWPLGTQAARERQQVGDSWRRAIELGPGVTMDLVRIPAGEFVMGDVQAQPDERPQKRVTVDRPFWMAACEVTNEQFRLFDPDFDCRYYAKRHARADDRGLPLNGARQPAVRVSWDQATAYCRWLTERTGVTFALPSEAQWEYACRAGTGTALFYGAVEADFSPWANVGDKSFATGRQKDGKQITGGVEHLAMEGAALADVRFDDGAAVTAVVGSYQPNVWGLYDMHGNAAEWTATTCGDRKVVRGGSFFDRPARCQSGARQAYPRWQHVFNVGFRIVAYPSEGGSNL